MEDKPKHNEVKVYMDNKPAGYIRVNDGQLLLYPNDRTSAHITTQNLDEVREFFKRRMMQRSR